MERCYTVDLQIERLWFKVFNTKKDNIQAKRRIQNCFDMEGISYWSLHIWMSLSTNMLIRAQGYCQLVSQFMYMSKTHKKQLSYLKIGVMERRLWVPQGLVVGPVLFTLYTTPLWDVSRHNCMNYHLYENDKLFSCMLLSCKMLIVLLSVLRFRNMQQWMQKNSWELYDDNTDFYSLARGISTLA